MRIKGIHGLTSSENPTGAVFKQLVLSNIGLKARSDGLPQESLN